MESIIATIIPRYYSLIPSNNQEGAPRTRYKSWEYCHQEFLKYKGHSADEEIKDRLALHLGFYLASWGMYRGSTYLLQRDYKTHKKAVEVILNATCKCLWDYNPEKDDDQKIQHIHDALFGLETGIYWQVKKAYSGYDEEYSGDDDNSSQTLITKILLGTFGCIPAYDRFFKAGIKEFQQQNLPAGKRSFKVGNRKLTQSLISAGNEAATESFMALAHLARLNPDLFYIEENKRLNRLYPPMKYIDMFFWEIGYEVELINMFLNPQTDENEKKREKLNKRLADLKINKFCEDNYKSLDYERYLQDLRKGLKDLKISD